MTVIQSKLSPNGAEFQANAAAMQTIVDDLKAKLAVIAQGGSASARAKHVARGKLLPRERVERLLDAGTPFLEVSPMAAYGMYDADIPAAGVIAGIGRVAGIDCMIVCNDATVKGGTYYPITVKVDELSYDLQQPHVPGMLQGLYPVAILLVACRAVLQSHPEMSECFTV